nr:short peptide [Integration vector]QDQ17242.1 short peptide [Integration vector]
MVQTSDI